MKLYMSILRFVIIFLLLLGINKSCFGLSSVFRCFISAAIGGVYTWVCLLPGFHFLGNTGWYMVFVILIGFMCFGFHMNGIRPVVLFFLINMVLDNMISEKAGLWTGLLGIVALILLCGFGGQGGRLVPVRLTYDGKQVSVMALMDTGNTLIDPITGKPVLVIGAQVAGKLMGLTKEQLQNPVESLGLLPGLRLLPFTTIGRSGCLMLAMRFKDIRIGNWKGSGLVAFAPECVGKQGTYQALTGGTI